VIVDPPSHQKGGFVASQGHACVLRRLPGLLAPGLAFGARLPNPPGFEDVGPERALKVLVSA
jgi:23S rRNA (cytosine1962-C5)-methyltransferase